MKIIKETINRNSRRIWGTFKLSDGSKTHFECRKGEAWFQWSNYRDNLWVTVERVEELTNKFYEGEV